MGRSAKLHKRVVSSFNRFEYTKLEPISIKIPIPIHLSRTSPADLNPQAQTVQTERPPVRRLEAKSAKISSPKLLDNHHQVHAKIYLMVQTMLL